jgi:hypothetical protein
MKRKKQHILLVEPGYNNPYPPLGLMKISSWHKKRGDWVDFVKDGDTGSLDYLGYTPPSLKKKYDRIYITSLFTYHAKEVIKSIKSYQSKYPDAQIKVGGILATLLPSLIQKETGIKPHIGLLDGPEKCSPDYQPFPNLQCSITFTSRGCKRKCHFCAVKLHEPNFFVKEHWEKDIDLTKKKIIFWDNNWFLSPNFIDDVEKLKKIGKPFDFNQGLDCRLFDESKARLLSETKIKPLRFAFDNHSEEGHIQNAIKTAKKFGFKDIRVYVLYNSEDSKDTPEYFFYRIDEINKLGALSYPMRYRSINNTKNHYASPNWDRILLRGLKLSLIFYYSKGMIRKSREAFINIFGKNFNQFRENMYKIYAYDKQLDNKESIASKLKDFHFVDSTLIPEEEQYAKI